MVVISVAGACMQSKQLTDDFNTTIPSCAMMLNPCPAWYNLLWY